MGNDYREKINREQRAQTAKMLPDLERLARIVQTDMELHLKNELPEGTAWKVDVTYNRGTYEEPGRNLPVGNVRVTIGSWSGSVKIKAVSNRSHSMYALMEADHNAQVASGLQAPGPGTDRNTQTQG